MEVLDQMLSQGPSKRQRSMDAVLSDPARLDTNEPPKDPVPLAALAEIQEPTQDDCFCKQAEGTTDCDEVKSQSEHGPLTELQELQIRVDELQQEHDELKARMLCFESLDDAKFPFYTNLPSRAIFSTLLSFIEERGAADLTAHLWVNRAQPPHFAEDKDNIHSSLSVADQLFLVLVKLKMGHPNFILSTYFGLPEKTISQIVRLYVNFLSVELKDHFEMSPVSEPEAVVECYQQYKDLKTIIDCVEVIVKEDNYPPVHEGQKVKLMIGVAPDLHVNYVSAAWRGSFAGEKATLACEGMLDHLPHGSAVMTHRCFTHINEGLISRGVKIIIPKMDLPGPPQMTCAEQAASRRDLQSRLWIDRIMERLGTFQILAKAAELLIMQDQVEQIVTCCAYLGNYQSSVKQS